MSSDFSYEDEFNKLQQELAQIENEITASMPVVVPGDLAKGDKVISHAEQVVHQTIGPTFI